MPSVAGALDGGHHGVPGQLLQILQAQVQLLRQQRCSQRQCCGSGSVIICTDPDPSINKQKKSKKNHDFYYFLKLFLASYL